jgi:hypothetical protein
MTAATDEELATSCASSSTTRQNPNWCSSEVLLQVAQGQEAVQARLPGPVKMLWWDCCGEALAKRLGLFLAASGLPVRTVGQAATEHSMLATPQRVHRTHALLFIKELQPRQSWAKMRPSSMAAARRM